MYDHRATHESHAALSLPLVPACSHVGPQHALGAELKQGHWRSHHLQEQQQEPEQADPLSVAGEDSREPGLAFAIPAIAYFLMQKRPHLSLSRKLSYSSALREAQNSATTAHRSEAPPSPGFPSLLTVASSLASSLRTCSQHLGSTAVAYPPAEEDHLPGLPLDLHCTQRTPFVLRSAPLSRNAVPSSSSSSLPRRLETLRAASTSYDRSNTSQILEGDFLQPRPATSRISSTDSLEYRNMRACSEELPSSPMYEPQSACGLVAAVEDDAMDEDMAGVPDSRWSTEQMNPVSPGKGCSTCEED